jgi:hypothetical protein
VTAAAAPVTLFKPKNDGDTPDPPGCRRRSGAKEVRTVRRERQLRSRSMPGSNRGSAVTRSTAMRSYAKDSSPAGYSITGLRCSPSLR